MASPSSQPPQPGSSEEQSEAAFQEAEADVNLDDLVTMQYEMPLEDDDSGDGEDFGVGLGGGDEAGSSSSSSMGEEEPEAPSRKVAVLLELLSAANDLDVKVGMRDLG